MRASNPPCRQTPVSTIRQRYMINCPVSRPAGLVTALKAGPTGVAKSWKITLAMDTYPYTPKTRSLCSLSGT